MKLTGLVATIFLLLAPALASAGTIKGVISTKKPGDESSQKIKTQTETCGTSAKSQALVVNDGKVQWAVVSLKGAAAEKAAANEHTLDQKGCRYAPHVISARKGDKLKLVNSDVVLHNVHVKRDGKKTLFNLAMPIKDQKIRKKLKKTGVMHVGCDAGHTWMSAYVLVFDHPYHSVTGADGGFLIENVPAGTYQVEVWHETLGAKSVEVTVAEDTTVNLEL